MGKDLRGKELGVGISQRKDGLYSARFTSKATGKVKQKYFQKLQECRQWYADAVFNDEHGSIIACGDMTVDAWFEFWLEKIKKPTIKIGTFDIYKNKYEKNIKPVLGRMLLSDVKTLHCQQVVNEMSGKYAEGTIDNARTVLHGIFEDAVSNDFIPKNPVRKVKIKNLGKKKKDITTLTKEEQLKFLEESKKTDYYNQFAFLLQTGIRVGEMNGLQWDDIDFKKHILHIKRQIRRIDEEFVELPPKTDNSIRDIPLTEEAIRILKDQREKNKQIKVIDIKYQKSVFITEKGILMSNPNYNDRVRKICKRAGLKNISMHVLRHTFATRCIEGGMRPKTLQMILGHSKLSITMDMYVHVTDEEKQVEVDRIENYLKVV